MTNKRTYQPNWFVGVDKDLVVAVCELESVASAARVRDHSSAARRVRAERRGDFACEKQKGKGSNIMR